MQNSISISRIWADDSLVELRVTVTDQSSSFSNTVYVDELQLAELCSQLRTFRNHVHGGIKDIRLGEFGAEYANGAFHARLHFRSPGKLYISTRQQTEFKDFSITQVASEASMYLLSEPILLDSFLGELERLIQGSGDHASLACV